LIEVMKNKEKTKIGYLVMTNSNRPVLFNDYN